HSAIYAFVDETPKPARGESAALCPHQRHVLGCTFTPMLFAIATARLSFTRRMDFAGVALFLRHHHFHIIFRLLTEIYPALSEAADCRKSKGHIGANPTSLSLYLSLTRNHQ
ncbi:hypothetical protein D6D27_07965, partial [Aureobasidium pullulans]